MSAPSPFLSPEVLEMVEIDRRYFRRRPDRVHRIRLAARCEIKLAETRAGITAPIPIGFRAFVGVREIGHGHHERVIGFGLADAETDLPEDEARRAFEQFRTHNNATLLSLHHPRAPSGAEVLICEGQEGGWLVYDMSASGDSAGGHGYYATWAEAVVVARQVAKAIGGTFVDGGEEDAA